MRSAQFCSLSLPTNIPKQKFLKYSTMFTKLTLLVILGCTLALASPVHEVEGRSVQRSILGTFAEWLHKADGALDTVFDRVKQPFEKIYGIVIGAGEGVVDYSVEKLQQVISAYYDIKYKSEQNLNKIKNTFLARVITQLQTVVETLTQHDDAETVEQLKQKIKDISESSKESLIKLQHQLEEAINAEKHKLELGLSKWETEAKGVIKRF